MLPETETGEAGEDSEGMHLVLGIANVYMQAVLEVDARMWFAVTWVANISIGVVVVEVNRDMYMALRLALRRIDCC